MNLASKKIALFMLAATLFAAESKAQIIVNIRPPMPRRVAMYRPAPRPGYVWIAEDWAPRGRGYAYRGGYWAKAPRPHAYYTPGKWHKHGKGYSWKRGYWR
ncbi:hypothetical protein [Polluticoccus soli]|uniref:hypothetical protein n=1 Tax=Polluticoccus soli TaxID=3034150 RepID=UPI0023E1210F|nr:hypothetical protein [Flavipsychrobacter sp. JY13-12]